MAILVLDANVVIALLDESDALHERAAESFARVRSEDLVLPASAYAEVLVGPFKMGTHRVAELDATLARVPIRVEPITAIIARTAARLRASSDSLHLADALVLATAAELGASVLTADRRLARHPRVRSV